MSHRLAKRNQPATTPSSFPRFPFSSTLLRLSKKTLDLVHFFALESIDKKNLHAMEDSKLQALADSLSKNSGRKGLGTYSSGAYSWAKTATAADEVDAKRTDGLPNNALYSNFVKEGGYDTNQKTPMNHGDGRAIKRDFSDIPVLVEDGSDGQSKKKKKLSKEEKKAAKKAAKLEAKKQAKLDEKKQLKKAAREQRADETSKRSASAEPESLSTKESKKRKRNLDEPQVTENSKLKNADAPAERKSGKSKKIEKAHGDCVDSVISIQKKKKKKEKKTEKDEPKEEKKKSKKHKKAKK